MAVGDPAPGSLWLAQLIGDGRAGALRADLRHFYQLDLLDVWRGSLSPLALYDLVEHMPDDSALQAQLRGGRHHRGWSVAAYLTAAAVDASHDTAWVVASANSRKSVKRPARVERPGGLAAKRGRALDLSGHPMAKPLPPKYRGTVKKAITKGR
ncbi:hypothetical protein [Streptomyces fructofermentans]|uniref:Uncharacterized protein n=1 Tax=Streptomyces fructofermentans TaxID=152141 RepID=A0A918U605_9ACTN|nr:hypothetical protein [Streptomyces fructofermentans]GGX98580.1 hypothetical protein GCM10010515_76000 [Streptomyces fructofermentans]